jgi:heme exporter protein CcmD
MDFTSPHFGFVAAAYVLSGVVLAGLFFWIVARKRALEAEAARVLKDGA